MSISKELNEYEFESLESQDAEIIRNGLYDYSALLNPDEMKDQWIDNLDALESVVNNLEDNGEPETLHEILDLIQPLDDVSMGDASPIFSSKRIEQVLNFYQEDPLIVSIVDVLYRNIDSNFDYYLFFEDLSLLLKQLEKKS